MNFVTCLHVARHKFAHSRMYTKYYVANLKIMQFRRDRKRRKPSDKASTYTIYSSTSLHCRCDVTFVSSRIWHFINKVPLINTSGANDLSYREHSWKSNLRLPGLITDAVCQGYDIMRMWLYRTKYIYRMVVGGLE